MHVSRSLSAPFLSPSRPSGFQNAGNTCFANSAIQCLLSSSVLSKTLSANPDLDFSSPLKRASPRKTELILAKSATAKWLQSELLTLLQFYSSSASALDISSITRSVSRLSSCLRAGRQEDAHEFVRALLSSLTLDGFNKPLTALLSGTLVSAVTCTSCGTVSTTVDSFMDLSLDIAEESVETLESAMDKFTEVERLSEDNLVDCGNCKCRRVVTKVSEGGAHGSRYSMFDVRSPLFLFSFLFSPPLPI